MPETVARSLSSTHNPRSACCCHSPMHIPLLAADMDKIFHRPYNRSDIPCFLIQSDISTMHGIDARLSLCSPRSQSTPASPLSRKQSIWELPRLKVQGTNECPVAQPARRTGTVRPRNQNRTPVRKHWRDPSPTSREFPKFFVPGYLSQFCEEASKPPCPTRQTRVRCFT